MKTNKKAKSKTKKVKKTDKVRVRIKVDDVTYKIIEEQAKKEGISKSAFVTSLITDYLDLLDV